MSCSFPCNWNFNLNSSITQYLTSMISAAIRIHVIMRSRLRGARTCIAQYENTPHCLHYIHPAKKSIHHHSLCCASALHPTPTSITGILTSYSKRSLSSFYADFSRGSSNYKNVFILSLYLMTWPLITIFRQLSIFCTWYRGYKFLPWDSFSRETSPLNH